MYNPRPLVRFELTLLSEKTSPSVLHYTKEAYLETIVYISFSISVVCRGSTNFVFGGPAFDIFFSF